MTVKSLQEELRNAPADGISGGVKSSTFGEQC